jgi:hypothetical protein
MFQQDTTRAWRRGAGRVVAFAFPTDVSVCHWLFPGDSGPSIMMVIINFDYLSPWEIKTWTPHKMMLQRLFLCRVFLHNQFWVRVIYASATIPLQSISSQSVLGQSHFLWKCLLLNFTQSDGQVHCPLYWFRMDMEICHGWNWGTFFGQMGFHTVYPRHEFEMGVIPPPPINLIFFEILFWFWKFNNLS